MKKIIGTFFIFITIGIILFFIGWSSFIIPQGSHAVLVSKTGGVYETPIESGSFHWNWELLIPTNAELKSYVIKQETFSLSINDSLPLSNIYEKLMSETVDFMWKIDCSIQTKIKPSVLPMLVKESLITDQESLEIYHQKRVQQIFKEVISNEIYKIVLDYKSLNIKDSPYLEFDLNFKNTILSLDFFDIEIVTINDMNFDLPDFSLYNALSEFYIDYQQQRKIQLSEISQNQASKAVDDFITTERLLKWGNILTTYPILIDFISASNGNLERTIKLFNELF